MPSYTRRRRNLGKQLRSGLIPELAATLLWERLTLERDAPVRLREHRAFLTNRD